MNQYSILKTITTSIFIVLSSTISAQEKTSKIETSPAVKTLIKRKIEINKSVFKTNIMPFNYTMEIILQQIES